jgi:uncharacterized protein GlcG (DUF336 family)
MTMASIPFKYLAAAGVVLAGAVGAGPADAQVGLSGYTLPLSLAIEAATEAIRVCEAQGFAIMVSVVDASGVVKLQAKGDHSTVHTKDTAFRKAYTVVTLGPIYHFDTSAALFDLMSTTPIAMNLRYVPDVIALPGGVAIKRGDEIVAAIGVAGAPGGAPDEACARAGVAKIHDRVEAARQAAGVR